MRHLVLATATLSYDEDRPIAHVEPLGVARSDRAAIDMIARHYSENSERLYASLMDARSPLPFANRIWILRGGGARGDEITGGVQGTTLYRAIPLKD